MSKYRKLLLQKAIELPKEKVQHITSINAKDNSGDDADGHDQKRIASSKSTTEKSKTVWFSLLGPVMAAVTWAAAMSQFVDILDFIEGLLNGWRDFFRDLWAALFLYLKFPYSFTAEQKDALTLLTFMTGISIHPYFFGQPTSRLFDHPRNNKPIYGDLKAGIYVIIMSAFLAPFVSPDYFIPDIENLLHLLLAVLFVMLGGLLSVSVLLGEDVFGSVDLSTRKFANLTLVREMYRFSIKMLAIMCFLTLPTVLLSPELRAVVFGLNPYTDGFSAVSFVNILLAFLLGISAIAATRKSIMPIVKIVVVGLFLLLVGMSAETLVDAFNKNIATAP